MQKQLFTGFLVIAGAITSKASAQTFKDVEDVKSDSTSSFTCILPVEQMPVFPGDIRTFLRKNMVYPKDAYTKGIEGRVVVRFFIDEDGHVMEPKVEKGVYLSLDSEAIRLMRFMPAWKPGLKDGRPVRVYYRAPLIFRLD